MKSRATLKRERDEAVKALNACREDRVAVHERLAEAGRERDDAQALLRAGMVEVERAEGAVAEVLSERDALRAEAQDATGRLAETIGQRDSWSERAQEMTVARDEALEALRLERALRVATEDERADTALKLEQALAQREEILEQAQLATTERNQAWADRDEAVRECGSAQEDARVLAERLQQAEDALIVLARERVLQRTVELQDGRIVPLKACSLMGVHVGHAWWPRADKPLEGQQMHWCDGRNPDGTEPYDPGKAAVMTMREDASPRERVLHDDHPGPAGAERLRADEFGGGDPRVLIEHWQGVAKRLEAERDEAVAWTVAVNDALGDRRGAAAFVDDAVKLVVHALHDAEAGYSQMHSRVVQLMEERDSLLVENEALSREREDALEALQQVKAERDELRPLAALRDPVVAQDRIVKATERMHRAEAEFDNLRRERDAAIERATNAESDLRRANELWTETVQGVRREVGEMQRERDAWSERAETHEQERDSALAACEAAQSDLREATRSWERAMRKVVEERDAAVATLENTRALLAASESAREEAQAAAEAARAAAVRDSMIMDGALENALSRLAGMLGVDLMRAFDSPADLIEQALDAIRDARREAGRMRLVLDLIDERKAAQPVDVERREPDA